VASTSAKPTTKTTSWSKTNGFESQVVKDLWFYSLMVKIKLKQELDGQKLTLSSKINGTSS
jgi:hypothetical protein